MAVALLITRVGLAAVFAAAGIGKLADRPGARKAAIDFGAPDAMAGPLAVLLPLAELAVAVLLLPATTARWGAIGAIALLAIFSAAIGLAIRRGQAPDCHCFGQLHSEPAGAKALIRNGLLAAVAVFIAAAGWSDSGPSALAWVGTLDATQAALLVVGVVAVLAVAGGGLMLFRVMRSYGQVLLRLEQVEDALADAGLSRQPEPGMPPNGHAPGTAAPDFSLSDTLGGTSTLDELLEPGLPLLVLFTNPTCGPCAELMPMVSTWRSEHGKALTIEVVSTGEPDAVRAEAEEHGLDRLLIDEGLAMSRAYEANGTPSAVMISPEREIASWVASGSDWVERLLGDAVAVAADSGADGDSGGLAVGEPAPDLELPDLEGRNVELSDLRGSDVALLFWNPSCGHCRAMHDDLLAWEADRPSGDTGLVIVSSGEGTATRDEGFASRVLLDADFAAGDAFSAGGTPMAVRIDSDGNVASPLAAGSEAVLTLVGAAPGGPQMPEVHLRRPRADGDN